MRATGSGTPCWPPSCSQGRGPGRPGPTRYMPPTRTAPLPPPTTSVPTSKRRAGRESTKNSGNSWRRPLPRSAPAGSRAASARTRNTTTSKRSRPGPRPQRPYGYSSAYIPETPWKSAGAWRRPSKKRPETAPAMASAWERYVRRPKCTPKTEGKRRRRPPEKKKSGETVFPGLYTFKNYVKKRLLLKVPI